MTDKSPKTTQTRLRSDRPAGSIAVARLIAKELAADGGVLPLEILVKAMRSYWHSWKITENSEAPAYASLERATYLAERAAPYFHAQLARVEHTGNVEVRAVARVPDVAKDVGSWKDRHGPPVIDVTPEPEQTKPMPKTGVLMK